MSLSRTFVPLLHRHGRLARQQFLLEINEPKRGRGIKRFTFRVASSYNKILIRKGVCRPKETFVWGAFKVVNRVTEKHQWALGCTGL